ncbi:MAG: TIGR04372 family glycosyltransferase [Candidatus Omnitrophica bacterium]|nr:TIGR04372 family glycosyltransferase [Candidatus Omnitrophota bacterium]
MSPLTLLLAVSLRIVLKGLKPFVHIRFGRLWGFGLGVFALPTEIYLCQRDAGMLPKRSLDVFYHYNRTPFELKPEARRTSAISNEQLDKMLRPHLRVLEGVRWLDEINRFLPWGSEDFIVKMPEPHNQDRLLDRFPAHLSFTEEELERGRLSLRDLGVPLGAPFVCFHARDDAWVHRHRPRMTSLYGQWHRDIRNSSIHNYLLAAERLASLGYFCIRMGKYVEEPLETTNPRIIDYAAKYQSDFMDIYLSAHCAFFIGQNSGMPTLPVVLRRPVAFVNVAPLSQIPVYCSKNSLFIPKTYYSKEKGRLLTFHEMLTCLPAQLSHKLDLAYYERIGLEILENTPEEIAELSLEMHERLQAGFRPSREDEALLRRLWSVLSPHPDVLRRLEDPRDVWLGTHFSKAHPELLE